MGNKKVIHPTALMFIQLIERFRKRNSLASASINERISSSVDAYTIIFNDIKPLENAIDIIQSNGIEILDIQSPHYLHFKNVKEIKESNKYGFIAGISAVIGFALISLLIWYVMSKPQLLLGNKNSLPIMAYIPVLFTVSILFSGLGLVLAFGIKNHLLPGQQNQIINKQVSSDRYILIIKKQMNIDEVRKMFPDMYIANIFEHKFIKQNISLPLPLKLK